MGSPLVRCLYQAGTGIRARDRVGMKEEFELVVRRGKVKELILKICSGGPDRHFTDFCQVIVVKQCSLVAGNMSLS